MSKWKIFDLRIDHSVKALEVISIKLFFNSKCKEIINLFDNLKKSSYYYFLGDKRLSYLLAEAFNLIKGHLTNIKNIRKDAAFKLTILTYIRKSLYFFLLNFEFLSKDVNADIDLTVYPMIINSFNEIDSKFDAFIKYVMETYKLNNKYLNTFFCRDYYREYFKEILDNFIETYKLKMTVHINKYFLELERIENFIVTDFFDSNIRAQIDSSGLFMSNYTSIPEQCLLDGLFNDFFDFISRKYNSWENFEYDLIKEKLSEVQGKILTLKLTDSLLKVKLVKITKSFEEFFKSDEQAPINAFNISFAFSFRQKYSNVLNIIQLKEFSDKNKKKAIMKFIYKSAKALEDHKKKGEENNKIFFKMRTLKNLSKFVTKLIDTYHQNHGDPNKKSGDDDDGDREDEEKPVEEEMKKPPELEEKYLPCRYFPYKKKTRQNFAYIKNKFDKKNQGFAI